MNVQHAEDRRDDSEAGPVRVFPVRIHTNLKAETLEDFERKKKGLHISAFKFRIDELRHDLRQMASNSSRAKEEGLKDGSLNLFIESIINKVYTFTLAITRCSSSLAPHRSNKSLISTIKKPKKNTPTTWFSGAWFQSLYKLSQWRLPPCRFSQMPQNTHVVSSDHMYCSFGSRTALSTCRRCRISVCLLVIASCSGS
jgi:hypothetical protein